jgi:dihydrolipoamide dehydrogenase
MHKVAIIGGGPGGYVAAIRLQQYGIDCVVFEKKRIGGVCLNEGCIPTKSLVKVADLFSEMKEAESFGLKVLDFKVDYEAVWQRKNRIVEQLVSGVEFIFKKRNIPIIKECVIEIKKIATGYKIITTEGQYQSQYLILATGSQPKELPFLKFDGEKILSSTDILDMKELPESLVVIGGGVIGCEFASIYNQMGVKTHVIEFLPNLIATEDNEISKRLNMALKKSGIAVLLNTSVDSYENSENKIVLNLSDGKKIETEKVLLSVGRKALFDVTFESLELVNGFININDEMRTNLPNVFAIGDVTGKKMLAHTASKQGLLVADLLKNELCSTGRKTKKINYDLIPSCTFTNPEIGSVGMTEEQARERFEAISVGKFPFTANGKALGAGYTFGFVKTISDAKTKMLLGMHIIGPQATELIAQGGILLGTKASSHVIEDVIFAHPTLSEAIMESIEDLESLAIHKMLKN